MKHFIPKDKLSKKARKELDRKKRVTWQFSPVTRTVESKKIYKRHRKFHDLPDEWSRGIFYLTGVQQ